MRRKQEIINPEEEKKGKRNSWKWVFFLGLLSVVTVIPAAGMEMGGFDIDIGAGEMGEFPPGWESGTSGGESISEENSSQENISAGNTSGDNITGASTSGGSTSGDSTSGGNSGSSGHSDDAQDSRKQENAASNENVSSEEEKKALSMNDNDSGRESSGSAAQDNSQGNSGSAVQKNSQGNSGSAAQDNSQRNSGNAVQDGGQRDGGGAAQNSGQGSSGGTAQNSGRNLSLAKEAVLTPTGLAPTAVPSSKAAASTAPLETPIPTLEKKKVLSPTPTPSLLYYQQMDDAVKKDLLIYHYKEKIPGKGRTLQFLIDTDGYVHILSVRLNEKECLWHRQGDLFVLEKSAEQEENTVELLILHEDEDRVSVSIQNGLGVD